MYHESGTIPPPRTIGRLARLIIGVGCLSLVWQITDDIPGLISRGWPSNTLSVASVILGFYLLRPVANIGFTLKDSNWARVVVLALMFIIFVSEWMLKGVFFGGVFTGAMIVWMTYVYGHLGASFVVASVIRTPGCEMRALPHLWSLFSGHNLKEHNCPSFIRNIDEWEQNKYRS